VFTKSLAPTPEVGGVAFGFTFEQHWKQ
jgi:hypothetical protein